MRTSHQGQNAIRLLSGEIYSHEANVVCPACGSHYSQIRRAGTLTGSDRFEAVYAYEGTEQSGFTGYRRSAVEVVMECENCPCNFALVIQQHKGVNQIEIHQDLQTHE